MGYFCKNCTERHWPWRSSDHSPLNSMLLAPMTAFFIFLHNHSPLPPLGNLLPGPNSKTQSSSEHWLSLLLFYPLYFSWTNSAVSVSKLRNCHVYVKTCTCWVEHILDLSTWAFPQIQSRYSESLILWMLPHTLLLYTQ